MTGVAFEPDKTRVPLHLTSEKRALFLQIPVGADESN